MDINQNNTKLKLNGSGSLLLGTTRYNEARFIIEITPNDTAINKKTYKIISPILFKNSYGLCEEQINNLDEHNFMMDCTDIQECHDVLNGTEELNISCNDVMFTIPITLHSQQDSRLGYEIATHGICENFTGEYKKIHSLSSDMVYHCKINEVSEYPII